MLADISQILETEDIDNVFLDVKDPSIITIVRL